MPADAALERRQAPELSGRGLPFLEMPEPDRLISLDPAVLRLTLAPLGQVAVREPSLEATAVFRGRQPLRINYTDYADAVLTDSLGPDGDSKVRRLSTRGRRRLMCAVVRLRGCQREWKNLYASHLSLDERFFAVMRVADLLDARDIRATLCRLRERNSELARWAGGAAGWAASDGNRRALKVASTYLGFARGLLPLAPGAAAGAAHPPMSLTLGNLGVSRTGPGGLFKTSEVSSFAAGVARHASFLDYRAGMADIVSLSGLADTHGPLRKQVKALVDRQMQARRPLSFHGVLDTDANMQLSRQVAGIVRASLDKRGASSALQGLRTLDAGNRFVAQGPLLRGSLAFRDQLAVAGLPGGRAVALAATAGLRGFFREAEGWRERWAWLGAIRDTWREHPLWFLLALLDMRRARQLADLDVEAVENVLVDALEKVVREGDLVGALQEMAESAPLLNLLQRRWLQHGLEHAQRGEWDQAVPPLILGIEGALAAEARLRNLIPQTEGNFLGAEALVRRLEPGEPYVRFMTRRAYGGQGNAFRHGRAGDGTREQTLYLVLALVGWANHFVDDSTLDVTSDLIGDQVPAMVEALAPADLLSD
jgi:hypothetical protein